MKGMDATARRALRTIRECVHGERFIVLPHFAQQMDRRGLFWPDVLAVFDDPAEVRDAGFDRFSRPKWILSGTAADGVSVGIVCVLDVDERGETTVFITIY